MKHTRFIIAIIYLIPSMAFSQFENKCFSNNCGSQICFEDSINTSIIMDNGTLFKMVGTAKSKIRDKKLILQIIPLVIDSSYYRVLQENESDQTEVIVYCRSFRPDSSCKYFEYFIKVKDDFLNFGQIDESNTIKISDIKNYNSPSVLYIGGTSCNKIEIPIKYSKKTVYNVFLTERIHYITTKEIVFRILGSKENQKLRLLNTYKYYVRFHDSKIFKPTKIEDF